MRELIPGEEIKIEAVRICVTISWEGMGENLPECDAMVMLLNEKGEIPRRYDLVFYNMPAHRCGGLSILGEESDEAVKKFACDLDKVGAGYAGMEILLNVYEADKRRQDLGMIKNSTVMLSDAKTGDAICSYSFPLQTQGKAAAVLGQLRKREGVWYFSGGEQTYEEWMPTDLFVHYGLTKWKE